MKNIVILGGGFAGVSAALTLKRKLPIGCKITLVDRNIYHTFNPSLYEVATMEEPHKNVAITLSQIFSGRVEVENAEVVKIDKANSQVILKNEKKIKYDYLLLALGSESAYFGVEGLQKYSLALKSVDNAVKIQKTIKTLFEKAEEKKVKLKIFVGGGGFSGTELAAELVNYKKRLQKQGSRDLIEISIIEGTDRLLNGLDSKASEISAQRLKAGNVNLYLNSFIEKVEKNTIQIKDGPKLAYDILIWTGGVSANHILTESGFETTKSGQVEVNEFLQVKNFGNIFAAGDVACFIDPKTQKPLPGVAQIAEEQGKIAGQNIANTVGSKGLIPYVPRHFGYLVPLNGRFAYSNIFNYTLTGFWAWCLQQIIFLRYLFGILPPQLAFRRWNRFERDLDQA